MPRPPIPQPPYYGGCLCGSVRYSLAGSINAINACHCMDCKKLTGATNLLMVLSARAAFSSRGDVVKYRKKADSGRELDICRCQTCGVRMWHEPLSAPNLIFVAAGTLDEPSWVIPTSHIYVERVSPGVEMAGDALQVNGQPPNREVLMEAFSKAYPDYR